MIGYVNISLSISGTPRGRWVMISESLSNNASRWNQSLRSLLEKVSQIKIEALRVAKSSGVYNHRGHSEETDAT